MYFRTSEDHVVRVMNKDTVYVYWEKSLEYIGENKIHSPKRVCIGKEDPSSPYFMPPTATS